MLATNADTLALRSIQITRFALPPLSRFSCGPGRAAETTAPARSALSVRGQATGTSPRERRGRARRRSRCGRRRRRRARTRSCPALRGCRWGCQCRSWQQTLLALTPKQLDAGLDGPLSRPPNLRLCRPCGSYSTGYRNAACSSVKDVLKS